MCLQVRFRLEVVQAAVAGARRNMAGASEPADVEILLAHERLYPCNEVPMPTVQQQVQLVRLRQGVFRLPSDHLEALLYTFVLDLMPEIHVDAKPRVQLLDASEVLHLPCPVQWQL